MKRPSILVFCFLFVAVLAAAPAVQAGGFALYEWGNRNIGMATAGYTKGVDASVVAFNPSLMTDLEGAKALGGVALISPASDIVVNGETNETSTKTWAVPHAYYTQQLNDDFWFGAGIYTRFGLGTFYPDNWDGQNDLQYVNLQSVSFTPTMAYKVNDKLSFGAGLEILKGGISLEKKIGLQKYSARTEGYALGGNLSASYDFTDKFAAGFIYRAPMRMSTRGKADFLFRGKEDADQKIVATLPSSYTLGLSYEPTEAWLIEFDAMYTRWGLTDQMHYDGALQTDDELDYKNTWRFQLGTEYWVKEWLALRAGYAYDVTPTTALEASYMLPANDRHLFSTGLGFVSDKWTVDWSFMYVTTKERTGLNIGGNDVDFKNGQTWITGLSLGYSF